MRKKIFISYRRDDVAGDARGIHDRLVRKFGKSNIFMDVDTLLAGQRFDRELERALLQCDVLIAVIGPRWMDLLSRRSQDGERDYVRSEIAAALKRGIVVIPVLVGQEGCMPSLPRANELPAELRDLTLHQKHTLAHESFGRDTDELIIAIDIIRRVERRAGRWTLGAVAAAGATLAIAVTSYRIDIVHWIDRLSHTRDLRPTAESATKITQAKADTEHPGTEVVNQAPRPSAQEEIKGSQTQGQRKLENEAAITKAEDKAKLDVITNCDALAASPFDAARPHGIAGVDLDQISTEAASIACDDAMRRYTGVIRFVFQAGRVAHARKDYNKAADLYRVAAAQGSAAATNGLGVLYSYGLGRAKDFSEAIKLFQQAAGTGNALAMTNLGTMYEEGKGVNRDQEQARRWYQDAATLGELGAMNLLGALYESGNGVTKDYGEARKWYEKAAALGSPQAMTNLGTLHHEVQGMPRDYVEARKWYERAAALGDARAMTNLGALHHGAQGVPKNYIEARRWYEKGAALGSAEAMFNLGVIYANGQGVTRDRQLARNWYQKSADAGYEDAKAELRKINNFVPRLQ